MIQKLQYATCSIRRVSCDNDRNRIRALGFELSPSFIFFSLSWRPRSSKRDKATMRVSALLLLLSLQQVLIYAQEDNNNNNNNNNNNDMHSTFSRGMAAQGAKLTFPESPRITRSRYPEDEPQICLAFLSCCGRTDLLNHTIAAAIRHMEQDEPKGLRYEIAWVDNGSGADLTTPIQESYQIEHALALPHNTGLAFGMNLLISNLCRAPYILLLEEDWLYLDYLVATQTEERKRAISTAIALVQQGDLKSFDGRQVMGVFLRPETYNSFLKPPYAHAWAQTKVDLSGFAARECDVTDACTARDVSSTTVDYQIFCADSTLSSGYIWGSYTNGAGLYSRAALADIGRMYGEPGDAFHDRYVEVNYAYRAGLKYCHAAIQLGDCQEIANPECTAAFYHIGGGRGTRPRTAEGSKCIDQSWAFYGTDFYELYLQSKGSNQPICSNEDLQEMRDARAKEADSAEYRKEVRERNRQVFEMEERQRDELRSLARLLHTMDKTLLRQNVEWLADKTNDEISSIASRMEEFADSPHPLQGYWDSHGRPLV